MERRFRLEKDSRLLNIQNLFSRDRKDKAALKILKIIAENLEKIITNFWV